MRYLSVAVIAIVVWFNGMDTDIQVAEAQFDAVSIKRNTSSELGGLRRGQTLGRVTFENTPVDQLIIEAYGEYQRVTNVPDWVKNERYDIVATYHVNRGQGPSTTRAAIRRMLQALLEERFALQAELGPMVLHVQHIERPSEN